MKILKLEKRKKEIGDIMKLPNGYKDTRDGNKLQFCQSTQSSSQQDHHLSRNDLEKCDHLLCLVGYVSFWGEWEGEGMGEEK